MSLAASRAWLSVCRLGIRGLVDRLVGVVCIVASYCSTISPSKGSHHLAATRITRIGIARCICGSATTSGIGISARPRLIDIASHSVGLIAAIAGSLRPMGLFVAIASTLISSKAVGGRGLFHVPTGISYPVIRSTFCRSRLDRPGLDRSGFSTTAVTTW